VKIFPYAAPDSRSAILAVNAAENRARLIVIRPPESAEFGNSKSRAEQVIESRIDKVAERVGFEPTQRQIEISKLLKTCSSQSPGIPSPPRFWQ
jgi:hypothetical protein